MKLVAILAFLTSSVAAFATSSAWAAPNGSAAGASAVQRVALPSQSISKCGPIKVAAAKQACLDAEKAYRADDYKLSQSFLLRAAAIAPMDSTVHALLGRISFRTRDLVRAERELRQARGLGAADHFVLPTLFQVMVGRRESQRLLEEFPEPAKDARGDVPADILTGRALALASLDRVSEAAAAMDRSLALRRDLNGILWRETIAVQQNDWALATALTDEALKIDPKNGSALLARLQLLRQNSDIKSALGLSDQILRLYPHNVDTRMARFEIFLSAKQYKNANGEADALLARSPRAALGLYYKALVLARQGDARGAWKVAQGLPASFTQSERSYASEVSQMAIASGNVDSGAAILSTALTNWPDALDLRVRLAQIKLEQNSLQAALSILAPVKNSQDSRVRSLLAKINFKLDKLR